MFKKKKKQTAIKGTSSALFISVAIHVILFFIAGAFVAVEVIQRQEAKFEGKQIVRPKMKLKKLQVPVKIEKQVKRQAPKLSQRMTVANPVKTAAVDFKMPEMAGFGGGSGVEVAGTSFGGSLGFATTQINVFGLKSKGEKLLFILDTNRDMLTDEIGGIPAYKLIKDELISLIDHLPPTALFNVVIFERFSAQAFSPELSIANDASVQKLKEWLGPLNTEKNKVGLKTLPFKGTLLTFEKLHPIYNNQTGWVAGLSHGLSKGVDSIYWLGLDDSMNSINKTDFEAYKRGLVPSSTKGTGKGGYDYESYGQEIWDDLLAKAKQIHAEENARRAAKGQPMQVIPGKGKDHDLVHMIFPKVDLPKWRAAEGREDWQKYEYKAADVIQYIQSMQSKYSDQDRRAATIGRKKKELSFNVIEFIPQGQKSDRKLPHLGAVTERLNGKYLQIKGLRAIKSASTSK